MGATSIKNSIDLINVLLKRGQLTSAAQELLSVEKRKKAKDQRLPLAQLARRANQPHMALRLLHGLVRGTTRALPSANDAEKAEYAANLVRVGAFREAQILLQELDTVAHPEVLLFRTHAHVRQWEYAPTIDLLKAYVNSEGITEYDRLVGKVNLAGSLVHERRLEEARPLLDNALRECEASRSSILKVHTLKQRGELFLYLKDWAHAEADFSEALRTLSDQTGLEAFLIRKWQAILNATREKSARHLAKLVELRHEAKRMSHWETVRQVDLYLAIFRHDRNLLTRVCYGTPFAAFREMAWLEFGEKVELPKTYEWRLGEVHGRGSQTALLNLKEGGKQTVLATKESSQHLRLLRALASDFYRPLGIGELYALLYPAEHYDPFHGAQRLHQAIFRLRAHLADRDLPLQIIEHKRSYRLEAPPKTSVTLVTGVYGFARRPYPVREEVWRLLEHFGEQRFSCTEASTFLECTPRNALKLLSSAMELKLVHREGQARAARYVARSAPE